MPVFEIAMSVRTNLTIEVEAADAYEAWQIGGAMVRANDLDRPVQGRVTSHYIDEIDSVRRKQEACHGSV